MFLRVRKLVKAEAYPLGIFKIIEIIYGYPSNREYSRDYRKEKAIDFFSRTNSKSGEYYIQAVTGRGHNKNNIIR